MENNKKQTAVEWLVENYLPLKRGVEVEHEKTLEIVNKAKEMEKEQIVEAFLDDLTPSKQNIKEAEQYYNETYGRTI